MKKLVISLLLAAALALALTGCKEDGSIDESGVKEAASAAEEVVSAASEVADAIGQIGESEAPLPFETGYTVETAYGTIHLPEYKGLVIDKVILPEVTDDDVESAIDQEVEENQIYKTVDRAVKTGDKVVIDYEGRIDGELFDGGTASGYELEIGSGTFIDGFEDGIIGMKNGDVKTLSLKFPEQYHSEDLAGKDCTFDVAVAAIREPQKTEKSDEWVEYYTQGAQKTLEEYRKVKKEELGETAALAQRYAGQTLAMEACLEQTEFFLNQNEVDEYVNGIVDQCTEGAKSQGIELEDYLSYQGYSDIEEVKEDALANIKDLVVVTAIASRENLTVDDEAKAYITSLYGYDYDLLASVYGTDYMQYSALRFKVMNYLYENATQQ